MTTLTLFFTRGVSLMEWETSGTLARELALYQQMVARGWRVNFVTYGAQDCLTYADQLRGIAIYDNARRWPRARYTRWQPLLHAPALARSHVIKSNQVDGSEAALRAARLWRKPFVARCGYLLSSFSRQEHGPDSPQARQALEHEARVFGQAQLVIVTAAWMADDVRQRLPRARVAVIPNYVETERFRPRLSDDPAPRYDLAFVGRISREKNLPALLTAVRALGLRLLVVGDGPLRAPLQAEWGDVGGLVTWQGRVPHAELPALLRSVRAFVQPSFHEGHPKALLEAMACGLPVVGTDVVGVRECIRHEVDGLLCSPDAESLQATLARLLSDEALMAHLGQAARRYAVDHLALDKIAEREMAILQEIIP
ncbi:MAG: glycosyltransferase family 4 protein [Anaerolineae bacterium]|nr:glycosyltransferase family 4 protein [Anaerolineae bacterium]MDW8171607.1 glycosyltransferase family 4 protein [Anaerolineae bacterium]